MPTFIFGLNNDIILHLLTAAHNEIHNLARTIRLLQSKEHKIYRTQIYVANHQWQRRLRGVDAGIYRRTIVDEILEKDLYVSKGIQYVFPIAYDDPRRTRYVTTRANDRDTTGEIVKFKGQAATLLR